MPDSSVQNCESMLETECVRECVCTCVIVIESELFSARMTMNVSVNV
jgi:hypothetical protein